MAAVEAGKPSVSLRSQIRNQQRPGKKLTSFSFISIMDPLSAKPELGAQHDTMSQSSHSMISKGTKSTSKQVPVTGLIATGSQDKILRLYHLDQGQGDNPDPAVKIAGHHQGVITSITQMPKMSDFMLTGCADAKIRLYALSSLSEDLDAPVVTFDQGSSGISHLCPLSEQTFLSGGYDNSVRMWDIRQPNPVYVSKNLTFGEVTWIQKYN